MLTCFQGYVMFSIRASILRCQKIYHSLVGSYYPIKKYNPSFLPEREYSNGRGPLSFAVLLFGSRTSADTATTAPPTLSLTLSSLCRAGAYSPVLATGGGGGGRDRNNTTAKKPGILQFYCSMVPTTFEIGGRQ